MHMYVTKPCWCTLYCEPQRRVGHGLHSGDLMLDLPEAAITSSINLGMDAGAHMTVIYIYLRPLSFMIYEIYLKNPATMIIYIDRRRRYYQIPGRRDHCVADYWTNYEQWFKSDHSVNSKWAYRYICTYVCHRWPSNPWWGLHIFFFFPTYGWFDRFSRRYIHLYINEDNIAISSLLNLDFCHELVERLNTNYVSW